MRRYTHGSVLCFSSPLHPHLAFLPMLSLPNSLHPAVPPLATSNGPHCVMLPSLCPHVLIFQQLPTSENMRCLIFCSCVSLLRMMVSGFIHVPIKYTNSLIFMAAYYSMVYMCHIFFVQSIIDRHLGWFQVFAIVHRAAVNIGVHVSL